MLREIKTQDSPHADCVEAWRSCLAQKNIDINRKKIDKLWIQNYIREDTRLFWFLCGNEVYTDSFFDKIVLKVLPDKHFTIP